jgi:hypothetical protein
VVVHQRERLSCVVGIGAMDRPPCGEGSQGLFRSCVPPAGQEVTGGDDAAIEAAALIRRKMNWYRRARSHIIFINTGLDMGGLVTEMGGYVTQKCAAKYGVLWSS